MTKKHDQRAASAATLSAEQELSADEASHPAPARGLDSDAAYSAIPSPIQEVVSIPARAPRRPMRGIVLSACGALGVVCGSWALLAAVPDRPEHAPAPAAAQSGEAEREPSAPALPAPAAPEVKPEAVAAEPQPEPAVAAAKPSTAVPALVAPAPSVPTAKPAPAAASGSVARAPVRAAKPKAPVPARSAAQARPNPAAKRACNPNYDLDAHGNKHFKPECF